MNSQRTSEFNIVVISDVHLGEDLKASFRGERSPDLDLLERELVSFLNHYTFVRRDGRPWRLVANGDLVDFLGVSLLPQDERWTAQGADDAISHDDAMYGLGRRPRVARAQMVAVAERHPSVFRALARFLAVGHRLEIVAGNHDAEFQWPAVQEAFVDALCRALDEVKQSQRGVTADAADIRERVGFHPWFFYQPGVAWIEHGHLYDENCSMEFALAPANPHNGELIPNVDTAASRYVANHIRGAEHENWSAFGYLRWAGSLGMRGTFRLARGYYAFSAALLSVWRSRSRRPDDVEALRQRHLVRLRNLCQTLGLSEDTLDAVHELRRRPVFTNLGKLLGVLMIDKLMLAMVCAAALFVGLTAMSAAWALIFAGAIGGGAYAATAFMTRKRNVDPTVPLMLVPERIRRHVDVRYIVFGHTHEAVNQPLETGGAYLNTGTWYPSEHPGLLRAFTHVVIECGTRGPSARLCQWRDGASRAFTPGFSVHLPMLEVSALQHAAETQAQPA